MKFILSTVVLLSISSVLADERSVYESIVKSNPVKAVFNYINQENNDSCQFVGEKQGSTIRRVGALVPPISKPAIFESGKMFSVDVTCEGNKVVSILGSRTVSYVKYPYQWDGDRPSVQTFKWSRAQGSEYKVSIDSVKIRD